MLAHDFLCEQPVSGVGGVVVDVHDNVVVVGVVAVVVGLVTNDN